MKGNRGSQPLQDIGDAEARYRALVELAPIVVYEWEFGDPGRWRYLSPRVETLLGYRADEFIADPDLWWNRSTKTTERTSSPERRRARMPGKG